MLTLEPDMNFKALSITAMNVLSRGLHLLLFLSIGNRFGADATTDTVLFLQAPLLVIMSVTAGAAETVVMPAMHRAFHSKYPQELLRALRLRAIFFVTPVTFIVLLVAAQMKQNVSVGLLAVLAPMPILATFSSIHMGLLNAEGKHRKALLGPLYGSLISIPLLFVLPSSVYTLACILMLFELGRAGGLWLHIGRYKKSDADEKTIIRSLIAWASRAAKHQAIGSFFIALNPLVDILFANKLGTGAVTQLEYANRLWYVVPLLFSGHVTLAYASMSQAASRNYFDRRKVNIKALKLGIAALIVSSLAIVSKRLIINLLFGFGRMNEANLSTLANLLAFYLIGAAPFLMGLVFVRALSAEGRTKIMRNIAVISVGVNIILNIILIKAMGLNGIGLATSLAYIINTLLLAYLFKPRTFFSLKNYEN